MQALPLPLICFNHILKLLANPSTAMGFNEVSTQRIWCCYSDFPGVMILIFFLTLHKCNDSNHHKTTHSHALIQIPPKIMVPKQNKSYHHHLNIPTCDLYAMNKNRGLKNTDTFFLRGGGGGGGRARLLFIDWPCFQQDKRGKKGNSLGTSSQCKCIVWSLKLKSQMLKRKTLTTWPTLFST